MVELKAVGLCKYCFFLCNFHKKEKKNTGRINCFVKKSLDFLSNWSYHISTVTGRTNLTMSRIR